VSEATAHELAADVVAGAQQMMAHGLSRGTAGNVSARVPDGMLITPSNVPYESMTARDVVALTLHGEPLDSTQRRASTEWRLHAGIYVTRADVQAIVHTHSPYATALSCMRRGIPAFHYMVVVAGGSDIPCTEYALFGTGELACHAAGALSKRNACLLANHGVLAAGTSVAAALALALEVETLAQQYCIALQAGEPVLLSDAEINDALQAFTDYRR
jgi:L-fuculose-phosphate aldolase